jgi:hypothetical protein
MDARWPAVAIQAIFLAANIAFLLAGRTDGFILASVTALMLLFSLQAFSHNPRFLYLFPVQRISRDRVVPAPGWDTWILKGLLILSILFFYIGATHSYALAIVILVVGVGFPITWDRYLGKYNRRKIVSEVERKLKETGEAE